MTDMSLAVDKEYTVSPEIANIATDLLLFIHFKLDWCDKRA